MGAYCDITRKGEIQYTGISPALSTSVYITIVAYVCFAAEWCVKQDSK